MPLASFAAPTSLAAPRAARLPARGARCRRASPFVVSAGNPFAFRNDPSDVLTHAEDLLLDSCSEKEGEAAIACWAGYDEFHAIKVNAERECLVETGRCDDLERLEDIVRSAKGEDALVFLNQLNTAAFALSSHFETMSEAFDATDVDNSGTIDREELISMMGRIAPKISAAEVHGIFDLADADGNGVIDKDEFLQFLWQAPEAAPISSLEESGGGDKGFMHWLRRDQN